LAYRFGGERELAGAVAAVAVVLGHVFPLYHRFHGGKGVSTAAGVLFALNPWLGAGTLATWVVIAAFFRISSLAALIAAAFAPLATVALYDVRHPCFLAVLAVAAILVVRHKSNIANLAAGTEGRIGQRSS